MKTLETINNSIKRFLKGMFALFIINLLLFGGMLLVQSCQIDDGVIEKNSQKTALNKFESLVIDTAPLIQNQIESKRNLRNLKSKSKYMNTIDELEAQDALKPLVKGSKDLLLSIGFTENELTEYFGNSESPETMYLALSLLSYNKQSNIQSASLYFDSLLFIQSTYAGDVGPCIIEALGVEALVDLWKGRALSSFAARKALLKAVGKLLQELV